MGTSSSVFSEVLTDGIVSRNNRQHGTAVNPTYGKVTSLNDYLCGNQVNGLASGAGGSQTVSATGTASVYNGVPGSGQAGRGVAMSGFASASFGDQSTNLGNNAFSENVNCDFENAKVSSTINARNNQWRNNTTPNLCLVSGAVVNTTPTQHSQNADMAITYPAIPSNRFLPGLTVRVFGTGFDAIIGNRVNNCVKGIGDLVAGTSCCRKKDKANVCSATHDPGNPGSGNCVEIERSALGGGGIDALPVTSVTPTMIVAEIPSGGTACLGEQPTERVWVTKRRFDGSLEQEFRATCFNTTL